MDRRGRKVVGTWASALVVATTALTFGVPDPVARAAVAPAPRAATACTITWTGGAGDGLWRSTGNWDSGQMPSTADVACLPGTAGSVVINGDGGLTGAPVHVGAVLVDSGATLVVANSELVLDDATTTSVVADLEMTGTYAGLDGAGSIEIPAGGHWTWARGQLHGSGTVTVDAGATATIDPGQSGGLDTMRPLAFRGDLTVTAANRQYYMTSVGISMWNPQRANDAGGHITVSGTVTFDVTAASIAIYDNTRTFAGLDLGGVTTGRIVGGGTLTTGGLSALGGSWTLDPTAGLVLQSGSTQLTGDVTLGASSRFVLHNATVSGAVHAPMTGAAVVCPSNGVTTLANPAAFDDVPLVDLGNCSGTAEGGGQLAVPRGSTAHLRRAVFQGGSWIIGGGTVELTGDGDPATVDLAVGLPDGSRSGGQIRDATLVVDHGATATLDVSMGLAQLDPSAPNGSTSAFVNHGVLEWHDAYVGADGVFANGGPRFTNAADGTIVVRASKSDGRGSKGAYFDSAFNNGSPFVNLGAIDVQQGDLQVRTPANAASELSGSIHVAAGSALNWTPGHLTGEVTLDGAVLDGAGAVVTPGATLTGGDSFIVSGTLHLGAGTNVSTLWDYQQLPSGVLTDVVDGADGALTGTITVSRFVQVDGTLQITTAPTFRPTPLGTPPVITLASTTTAQVPPRSGTFATYTPAAVAGGVWDVRYGTSNVQLAAIGSPPSVVAPNHVAAVAGLALAVPVTAAGATVVTALNLPAGLTFDPVTGSLQGTLATPGTYTADFAAANAIGTTTSSVVIDVNPVVVNHAPGVEASVNLSTIYAPGSVTLDLHGTTDPDGQDDLAAWSVSISDGTTTVAGPSGDATTMFTAIDVPLPTPAADTTYDLAVTVSDRAGASTTYHVTVNVLVPQVTVGSSTATTSTSGPSADFAFAFTGRDANLGASWTFDPGDGSPLQTGPAPVPATITYAYATSGTYVGTLRLLDAGGHVLATATATASVTIAASNQPPVAVFDLYAIDANGNRVLVLQTDNPTPPPVVNLAEPKSTFVLDASRSDDPDGRADLASWTLDITGGPTPAEHLTGIGRPPANLDRTVTGAPTTGGTWTLRLTVVDRGGLSSSATAKVHVPAAQSPVTNRPPRAWFAARVVHAAADGVVIVDPTRSFDPDTGDSIASWQIDLIDLDGFIAKVDSGTGQPRAVPIKTPKETRGGTLLVRLTVADQKGATSTAYESIRFNDCVAATVVTPQPFDLAGEPAADGDGSGPQAELGVQLEDVNGKVAPGVLIGRSPLTVRLTDTSASAGAALVSHDLTEPEGSLALYGNASPEWFDAVGATTPIRRDLTLTNPFPFPLPVTFALSVTDSTGKRSSEHVTVVVLPVKDVVLRLTVVPKDPVSATSFDVTPALSLTGTVGWGLTVSGVGSVDTLRVFDPGPLALQRIAVPRPPGVTLTGTLKFEFWDSTGSSGAPTARMCVPITLPALTEQEVNQPPEITKLDPPGQHTTATSTVVKLAAHDPDPMPLGAVDAQSYDLNQGDLAGLIGILVNGEPVNPASIGGTIGDADFELDVPVQRPAVLPPAGSPQSVTVTVLDAWGGRASKTVQVWWDPPTQTIDSATLTATHAPANLSRAATGSTTETITLTSATASSEPVALGVDLPPDASFVRAQTDAAGSATPVDATAAPNTPVAGRWSCNRFSTGLGNRLVCSIPSLGTTNPKLYVTYGSASAASSFIVTAGATQRVAGSTTAALIASVHDATALTSLRKSVQDTVNVVGFTADAGPDQTVADQTTKPDSSVVQTRVTLDGSRSVTDGRPMTFSWDQTAGPLVTWVSPTTGSGTTLAVPGRSVQFDTPFLRTRTTLRFRLTVSVPAGNGRPASSQTDTIAVTVTPPANRPPVITGMSSTPDATLATPAPGAVVALATGATDPDGDAVSFTWAAWRGTGATGTAVATSAGPSSAQRTLAWPSGVQQLTVRVTANDGHGASVVRTFVLGVPLPAITLSIGGTVAGAAIPPVLTPSANAGDTVALTAVTNRVPSGGIRWTLVSGPAPAGVSFPAAGPTLTFPAPATTTAGTSLVVRATATDATGTVSVDQPITLGAVAVDPPAVSLVVWPGTGAPPAPSGGALDLNPVLVPTGGVFSVQATASGTGTLRYQWTTTPALTPSAPTAPATTFTAPGQDSFVNVGVTVTDSTGATASAARIVQVGAGLPTASVDCGNPVFSELVRQASANAAATGQKADVTIPIGSPPIGTVDLGPISFSGDCTTDPAIAFGGASFTFFNGSARATSVDGTATRDRLCLTGGSLTLPAELGLGAATLATAAAPLCISILPADWTSPDPVVADAVPNPAAPARTAQAASAPDADTFGLPAIACSGAQPITGAVSWPGAFPGITLPGPKQTTLRFDCGYLELTSSVSSPWGDIALRGLIRRDGSFEASVATKGMRLFGAASNTELTGKLRRTAAGGITWSVGADVTSPDLGVPGLTLGSARVSIGTSGLAVTGDGSVRPGTTAPAIAVHLAGTITGQDELTTTLTGQLTAPWTVVPGLTVQTGAVAANVVRAAGRTKVDLAVNVSGDWQVVAPQLSLRSIVVKVANHDPGASCSVVTDGAWFAQVSGTAHLDLGAPAPVIDLAASACVGLDVAAVQLSTTANLGSWKPVPGQDLTFDTVGFTALLPAGGGWTFDVTGHANYAGISLAGRARFVPAAGTLVFDVGGDLTALHLGLLAQGHVVITNGTVTGYQPVPLTPTDQPAPIDLVPGVTAFADIALPADMVSALDKILNPPAPAPKVVPIPNTIRFTAQLGGTSVKLEGRIAFPAGQGLTLFATCPTQSASTPCVVDDVNTTSLQLTGFFISIDTAGTLGFGGDGVLHLASTGEGRAASSLPIRAAASIDLVRQSFSLSLSVTGDWNDALGIRGLVLSDIAIQGGLVYASYPPIPTIGFGATVKRLPDALANMLGIQTDRQEPMTFVLNIAPTAPILQISLGEVDGHTFLKPIQPISAANADALTIDGASLVIAPLGGDVGPYHYDPGISLQFGGSLLGVTVNGAASVSLVPPHLHASLDVGDIPLGGTVVKATHLLFDATPSKVVVQASGGIDIQGGPRADLLLDVEATTVPLAASATFSLDVHNWAIPAVDTTLERLHIGGTISASMTSLPSGTFTAAGSVRSGTTHLNVTGTLALTSGRITGANLAGSVSGLTLGGITFSGPGCDGTGPLTGVCLRAAYVPTQSPPFSIGLDGTASIAGFTVDVTASFGPTGLHGTGTVRNATLGNPTLTGDWWFGSGLDGLTTTDENGVVRTVHAGDVRFTGSITPPAPLNGSSITGSIGKIGTHAWFAASGTLALGGRQLASAHLDISTTGISADGTFTLQNPFPGGAPIALALSGSITYAPSGGQTGFNVSVVLGAQPSSAEPAQRALGGTTFRLVRGTTTGQPTVFTAIGSFAFGGMSGSFNGTVSSAGNMCLAGSVTMAAIGASGSLKIGNSCANPGFYVDVTVKPVASAGTFRFTGVLTAGGVTLSGSVTDTRQLQISPTHAYSVFDGTLVQDWIRFSTSLSGGLRFTTSGGISLSLDFAANAQVSWLVRRATNSSPAPNGSVYVTNFDASIGVSFSGGQLCATIKDSGLLTGDPNDRVCI